MTKHGRTVTGTEKDFLVLLFLKQIPAESPKGPKEFVEKVIREEGDEV